MTSTNAAWVADLEATFAQRFWDRVDRSTDADACWLWLRARTSRGYGALSRHSEDVSAHRVAYELAVGPIPTGMFVRHTCDNPPCCNPAHLLVGTPLDNMQDKVSRGRQVAGRRTLVINGYKPCKGCGRILPVTAFTSYKPRGAGDTTYNPRCRPCRAAVELARRKGIEGNRHHVRTTRSAIATL